MENILLPSTVKFEDGEQPNEARLIAERCYYGYGTTIGNALRRVLLSSLLGAAVTAVKLKGVTHEFQAVPHVKEDMLQIILNLKDLRLRSHSDQPVKLTLKTSGERVITAGDLDPNADIEIANPDLYLCTLTDKSAEMEMELTVEKGRGWSPTEARDHSENELGTIAIDALFSPVLNVSYRVEETRVGDITDYDRLILTIETDGTVTPQEAVAQATKILTDNFQVIADGGAKNAQEHPIE